MKHLNLILSITLSFVASVQAFESAPNMVFVGSSYSGHEEITRQALNNISKKFRAVDAGNSFFEIPDLKFDLLPEPQGLFGYKSKNMVIHGNFASDFPKQTSVMSIPDFWNDPGYADFEGPNSQVIHFLRNYKNIYSLVSAKETCETARRNIKYVTQEALKAWERGDKTKALFLVGHATHTIQDSFSRAHTQRDSITNNADLKNICFYGNNIYKSIDLRDRNPKKAICWHSAPDSRDAIWNNDSGKAEQTRRDWPDEASIQCDKNTAYPTTEEQKTSCLSSEARLARVATEKYLLIVFSQMIGTSVVKIANSDVVKSLDSRLFEGPVGDALLDQKMAGGIMRCGALSDVDIIGTQPPEPGGG